LGRKITRTNQVKAEVYIDKKWLTYIDSIRLSKHRPPIPYSGLRPRRADWLRHAIIETVNVDLKYIILKQNLELKTLERINKATEKRLQEQLLLEKVTQPNEEERNAEMKKMVEDINMIELMVKKIGENTLEEEGKNHEL